MSRTRRKPQWVIDEVIYLKAVNPLLGGRKIAQMFNRRHASKHAITVSKSYVYNVLTQHYYQIQVVRQHLKHRRPKPLANNICWGVDLTTVTDQQGQLHKILAIVDYGSRRCLCLHALSTKHSRLLLCLILNTIAQYGKPNAIKTDNEAIFTSTLFSMALKLLSIRHQKSDVACPWQNGRVERFIGTFKQHMAHMQTTSFQRLAQALPEFQFYYNAIRPHQYLDGRTPNEVWQGIDVFRQKPKRLYRYEAWDGLLTGHYLVY